MTLTAVTHIEVLLRVHQQIKERISIILHTLTITITRIARHHVKVIGTIGQRENTFV